jgi:peptidyl-prolyl cis-trans isomerase C
VTIPPLARFIALGCLLFAAERTTTARTDTPEALTLSTATQRLLAAEVEDRLGRPAQSDEIDQAIQTWEDTSLLVADAQALGLDRGDPIVRRRLAQKMRYLIDDAAERTPPTAADLEAHLAAHPDRFLIPTRVALTHRFFDRGVRGADLDTSARAALSDLNEGHDAQGDAHAIGETLPLQTKRQLADSLGATFARAVVEAPLARWSGPYPSARGLHLVRVTERVAARPARLDEMRGRVEASWRQARRLSSAVSQLDALRRRHDLPARGAP